MNPERWNIISEICSEALSYYGVDRHRFLDQKCKDDEELRKEVESLIATYESDPDFLDAPSDEPVEDSNVEERVVGPYKIIKNIGQGGMGDVFLAFREDSKQHVALKLLRPAFSRANLLKRFEIEQQILAGLNHPNIARLLDIGQTEDRLPYLAMEYVDGLPITKYCDENKLSIEDRLELFIQVCQAVQYAHQNLVVHRDIKPSNLLVTPEGNVKLLDFGIAKILNAADADLSIMETQTGIRLMTPAYASPEQVQGQTITTNSDVYSLGVLLYELLTGLRPFDLSEKVQAEVYRIISEDKPTKPSTIIDKEPTVAGSRKLSVDRLKKLLSGELDNIVLKTLRKEPSRRYSSAQDLASDVKRYLDGLPVLAQPDSFQYRTSKFLKRHKWAAGMAALFAFTLIGFSGLTLYQSKVVAEERDRAQAEAAKSEQVTVFLQSLFETANPVLAPRDTIMVRDVLEDGMDRINNELNDQPELKSAMLNTMGKAFENLGRLDRSEELFSNALEISRNDLGKDHIEFERSMGNLIGVHRLNQAVEKELPLLLEYKDLIKEKYGEKNFSYLSYTYDLASNYHLRREQAKSDSVLLVAEKLQGQIPLEDDPHFARSLRSVGRMKAGSGDEDGAFETFKMAYDMEKRLYGDKSVDLSMTITNFVGFLIEWDRYEEAEPYLQELADMHRDFFPEGHRDVAVAHVHEAEVYLELGKLDLAEEAALKAVDMFEKLLGEREVYLLGWANNVLGHVLQGKEEFQMAENKFKKAIGYYVRLFGPNFVVALERRQDLALLYAATNRFSEAEAILLNDYLHMLEKRGAVDSYTEIGRRQLVKMYEMWDKPEEIAKYPQPKEYDPNQKKPHG